MSGGKMAEYAMGKQLMGGVPVLGDALHRVGEAANRGLAGLGGLGGAAAGFFTPDRVAGLLGDQLLDTVFDTLPQVQDNLDLMRRQQAAGLPQQDRLTGGDVALAAAGNFLMNALYNLGSEAVPAALRAIGEKLFANAPLTEAEQQALKEFYAGQDEAVDGAAGAGYDGDNKVVRRRTAGYTYVSQPLLEKCGCTREDLTAYLANTAGVEAAELYYRTDLWPQEIQVPKDPSVLTPGRGIDWARAPKRGYVLDQDGNPIRTVYVPQTGEIIDRYGPAGGRFSSPVVDGKPYTYDQRALPYLEDPSQYHRYQVIGDFSNLEHYVEICPDRELAQEIREYINIWYKGDYSKVITYTGEIAGVKGWGSGGGIQYELPFRVDWLEALGLLREI